MGRNAKLRASRAAITAALADGIEAAVDATANGITIRWIGPWQNDNGDGTTTYGTEFEVLHRGAHHRGMIGFCSDGRLDLRAFSPTRQRHLAPYAKAITDGFRDLVREHAA